VPNDIKILLEKINKLSRQLLSRMHIAQENIQKNSGDVEGSNSVESSTESQSMKLIYERETLIHLLFKQHGAEEIKLELSLLNKMVSLDAELTSKAQVCKKTLSEQVIRLKKGRKASQSYQKY
jgi:hypothetical protein